MSHVAIVPGTAETVAAARTGLDEARQAYLRAVQRACTAGTPLGELRTDADSTRSAVEQLINLEAGQRAATAGASR